MGAKMLFFATFYCLLESVSSVTDGELQALSSLYVDTGGQNGDWFYSSGWGGSDINPCDWFGVTCNQTYDSEDHVISIVLDHNGLTGKIRGEELKELIALSTFDLNGNKLVGSLPEELCGIGDSLKVLALWDNTLTGSIPRCYGQNFTSLNSLSLETNLLTGTLPSFEGMSLTLEFLWLYNNSFSGSLQVLGNMKVLNTIELRSNKFTGTIPNSLCLIGSSLKNIILWENKLTGQVPACFSELEHLEKLAVGTNSLTGSIPISVCSSSSLQWLLLNNNNFYGTLPECYGTLASLYDLQLDSTQLIGSIPETLCALSRLTLLSLHSNSLTGQVPSCFGNFQNLSSLSLESNRLTGPLPDSICVASHLQYLHFYNNKLTGTIPTCYGSAFPNLLVLQLQDNQLHGEIPSQWSGTTQAIVMSNNVHLKGTIPAALFSLTNLEALVIEGTNVHGTIPGNVGEAQQLQVLALAGNLITGTIPNEITTISGLKNLQLPRNQLTGTIPKNIGDLKFLRRFVMCGNLLSGHVPNSLGDIASHMDDIELDLNRLSCDLPASVVDWATWKPIPQSPAHTHVEILLGNLFDCPNTLLSADFFTDSRESSLYKIDKNGSSYRCGNSNYLPVFYALFLFALVTVFLLVLSVKRRVVSLPLLGFWMEPFVAWMTGSASAPARGGLYSAVTSLVEVLSDVAIVACLGLLVALPVFYFAPSSFSCQYLGRWSIAYKSRIGKVDSGLLGAFFGIVVVLLSRSLWIDVMSAPAASKLSAYIPSISSISSTSSHFLKHFHPSPAHSLLSSSPPSSPRPSPPSSPTPRTITNSNEEDKSMLPSFRASSPILSDDHSKSSLSEGLLVDDYYRVQRVESNRSSLQVSSRSMVSMAFVMFVVILCVGATLGPNIIYVSILVNSRSTASVKTAAQVGISLIKILVGNYLVPMIAVRTLMFTRRADTHNRSTSKAASIYRDRVTVEILHAALSLIFFPVGVVLLADSRCFYYYFRPRGSVTTTVSVSFCADTTLDGDCLMYGKLPVDSTFEYKFNYDGEQCVSAIFETYTPVFIATALLSPAFDLLIGGCLLPLYRAFQRYRGEIDPSLSSTPSSWLHFYECLEFTEEVEIDVVREEAVVVGRQIVERARRRLLLLMLTLGTFGLGAPLVAASCLLSALIVFIYHVHLLGRLSQVLVKGRQVEDSENDDLRGHLAGWDNVPPACGFVLGFSTMIFWCFISYPMLSIIPQVYGLIGSFTIISILLIYVSR